MWRYVLALSFVCACGGDEEAAAPVAVEEAPEEVAPEAPAEPERSPIDKARDLAVAGDMSGAIAAATALGAVVVWGLSEVGQGLVRILF